MYVFFNQKYTKRISIVNGYTKEFSVNKGEDVVAYLQPNIEHKKGVVLIYDLHGNSIDSVVGNFIFQDTLYKTKIFEKGYGYKNTIRYNTSKLKSGIYLFGNVVPFLVKDTAVKKAITVVFPYANIVALCNDGGKSFYVYNSSNNIAATTLSLNRQVNFNAGLFYFLQWMDSACANKNIIIISDLDLDNYRNIGNSKLLLLYGNSVFWTYYARKNFDNFQKRGGNVLAIATSIMNNQFRYEKKHHSIIIVSAPKIDTTRKVVDKPVLLSEQIFNYPNYYSVGCSYEIINEGNAKQKSFGGFRIIDKQNQLFKNVAADVIQFKSSFYNSLKVINETQKHTLNADKTFGNFYSKEILAYDFGVYGERQTLGGIFLMQKTKTSGKLLLIGVEEWCEIENFKNKNIPTVTKNCLDYLTQ